MGKTHDRKVGRCGGSVYDITSADVFWKEAEQLLKKTRNKLTEEDKKEFFDTIDKAKSSVTNEELLQRIVEFYEDPD